MTKRFDFDRAIAENPLVREAFQTFFNSENAKVNERNRMAPHNHPSRIVGRARDLTKAHLQFSETGRE